MRFDDEQVRLARRLRLTIHRTDGKAAKPRRLTIHRTDGKVDKPFSIPAIAQPLGVSLTDDKGKPTTLL